MEIIRSFVQVYCGQDPDPSVQPWKSFSWERMRTILKRIVCADNAELWDAANPGGQALGLNEFRRLEMDKCDGIEDPKIQAANLRSIGTSKHMLDKVYRNQKEESFSRSMRCRDANCTAAILPEDDAK